MQIKLTHYNEKTEENKVKQNFETSTSRTGAKNATFTPARLIISKQ
jgi:hypothetical protein